MGPGPQGSPQVLGDGRRPSQRRPRLLLRPHRLAAGSQAPRRHREGAQAERRRPARRRGRPVSEEVSAERFDCGQKRENIFWKCQL